MRSRSWILGRLTITERHHLQGCDHPHGLAVVDDRAFVACDGNGRLLVVDLASGAVHQRFPVGDGPDVLAYDAGLHRLYVESGVVATFDARADSISPLGRRTLAAGAHSAAVDPRTHAVYVPLVSVNGQPVAADPFADMNGPGHQMGTIATISQHRSITLSP